jgi:hypothetical protein
LKANLHKEEAITDLKALYNEKVKTIARVSFLSFLSFELDRFFFLREREREKKK